MDFGFLVSDILVFEFKYFENNSNKQNMDRPGKSPWGLDMHMIRSAVIRGRFDMNNMGYEQYVVATLPELTQPLVIRFNNTIAERAFVEACQLREWSVERITEDRAETILREGHGIGAGCYIVTESGFQRTIQARLRAEQARVLQAKVNGIAGVGTLFEPKELNVDRPKPRAV